MTRGARMHRGVTASEVYAVFARIVRLLPEDLLPNQSQFQQRILRMSSTVSVKFLRARLVAVSTWTRAVSTEMSERREAQSEEVGTPRATMRHDKARCNVDSREKKRTLTLRAWFDAAQVVVPFRPDVKKLL